MLAPTIERLYKSEWQCLTTLFNDAYPALQLDALDTIKVQYNRYDSMAWFVFENGAHVMFSLYT